MKFQRSIAPPPQIYIKIDKILYVVFFTQNTPNERVAR